MTESTPETDVLSAVLPALEAEGYEVFLQPSGQLLPPFFESFRPDAIALSEAKNLAIEVARESPESRRKLQTLSSILKNQPKWELRVFWVSPRDTRPDIKIQPLSKIKQQIAEAEELLNATHYGSALLLCWSAFEAIGRILKPQSFVRPQTPGRLVEILAREGFLTPTESDRLRELARLRNEFIHGEIGAYMDRDGIGFFVRLLSKLAEDANSK